MYETSEPYHTWAVWAAGEIKPSARSGRYDDGRVSRPRSSATRRRSTSRLTLGTVDVIYTGQAFAARTLSAAVHRRRAVHVPRLRPLEEVSRRARCCGELMDGYFKKGGNKPIAVIYYGVRHTTANKAINKPDDMKGLKLRVPDAPLYVMYPKVVGANATPIAFAEVYLALQSKTVDAQENPLPTILAKKFYEVQTHVNLTGHITEMLLTIVSGHDLEQAVRRRQEDVRRGVSRRPRAKCHRRDRRLRDQAGRRLRHQVQEDGGQVRPRCVCRGLPRNSISGPTPPGTRRCTTSCKPSSDVPSRGRRAPAHDALPAMTQIADIDALPKVMGDDEQFHAIDEAVELSGTPPEAWAALAIFWLLGITVFYQFFTRYVLNNSASWTEEIARYLLIGTVFVGAAIGVVKNNHIQVDLLYRYLPRKIARGLAMVVDVLRIAFCATMVVLTAQMMVKLSRHEYDHHRRADERAVRRVPVRPRHDDVALDRGRARALAARLRRAPNGPNPRWTTARPRC